MSQADEAQLLDSFADILHELGVQLTARGIVEASAIRGAIRGVRKYSLQSIVQAGQDCTCKHAVEDHSTIGCEKEVWREGGPTACDCSTSTGLARCNDRKHAEREFAAE
jgi:hypothetical protein